MKRERLVTKQKEGSCHAKNVNIPSIFSRPHTAKKKTQRCMDAKHKTKSLSQRVCVNECAHSCESNMDHDASMSNNCSPRPSRGLKWKEIFPSRRAFESSIAFICLIFMILVMEQVILSNEERKITLFGALENSAIKIFSNEKFYGYDDGFGIRIKQRFSAIIRRHLWQCESYRSGTISFSLFAQCKHEAEGKST